MTFRIRQTYQRSPSVVSLKMRLEHSGTKMYLERHYVYVGKLAVKLFIEIFQGSM